LLIDLVISAHSCVH